MDQALARFAVRTPTLPPATHTNVYVSGDRRSGVAVIDPASPYAEEQAALDAFLDGLGPGRGEVAAVVLTHHHVDHVSGAAHLAARLGVPVYAHPLTAALVAGRVAVTRHLVDGDRLPFGDLAVLHTPGHASGHLCFLDEQSGSLVAGDMVASVGTIIIDPAPGEGDMRVYLEQLARLRDLRPAQLLPSHGDPIADPEGLLGFYIAHRRQREERVRAALAEGPAPVEELVPRAYPDVAPFVYPLAARSLLAHLLKLEQEGRAARTDEVWRTTAQ